jgi:hypothetical protein
MKTCAKCQTEKPLTGYSKNKRTIDGYHWTCKVCIKTWQIANKEKLQAYQKVYQAKYRPEHKEEIYAYLSNYNKTVYKEKKHAYIKAWRERNPEKVKQYLKNMVERKQIKND